MDFRGFVVIQVLCPSSRDCDMGFFQCTFHAVGSGPSPLELPNSSQANPEEAGGRM